MSEANLHEQKHWLRKPLSVIFLLGIVLVVLSLIAVFMHQTRLPVELGGKIAFVSSPGGGNANILVFDITSGAIRLLTNMSAENEDPAWSPDGSRIAFSSYRDGNWEIYVVNADGTELKRLTANQARDEFPFWSPDGQWIGFTSNNDLYIMRSDGTEQKLLIDDGDRGRVWAGDWSPDGKKILYQSDVEGHFEIYVANADGSGRMRLTYTDWIVENGGARWSPAGEKIVFTRLKLASEVFVMDADGSNQTFLVKGAEGDWSPDGNWIVFREGGKIDKISIISCKGGKVINLVNSINYPYAAQPTWSP